MKLITVCVPACALSNVWFTNLVIHRVRLHLAMSLLHLLCNQKLHRRLVQPIGLVDRLSVFKKVHLTISSFLKAMFEAVVR